MRRIARLALASVVLALAPARAALAACGDGVLQAGEVCDASAPNGDVACRGARACDHLRLGNGASCGAGTCHGGLCS
jgi:hypothetical protein